MPNDPVSTWQTVANLGFATNFTTENTTTALTANATSWNRFTINGVNIDTANTNNLAVVIWTDETMANGYEWRVTKAKLEKSSIATAWKAKSIVDEQKSCEIFFEKKGDVILCTIRFPLASRQRFVFCAFSNRLFNAIGSTSFGFLTSAYH